MPVCIDSLCCRALSVSSVSHRALTLCVWCSDLSFNQISKIEGIETLTKLTDLCLTHNEISKLEGIRCEPNLCCRCHRAAAPHYAITVVLSCCTIVLLLFACCCHCLIVMPLFRGAVAASLFCCCLMVLSLSACWCAVTVSLFACCGRAFIRL